MSKKIKSFFIAIIIAFVAIIGSLAWFFIANDAPIINGEIICAQNYKHDLGLDIYLPTKVVYKKSPVVLFFHGGAWISGSKETVNINRFNGAFNTLRENGYAIVSPDYTLAKSGQSPFPICITDAFDAILWVENNAEKYNFDLNNVGVFGESAGGHIALMSAYSKAETFNTLSSEKIDLNYVVDVYGPSDLEELYKSSLVDTIKTYLAKLPDNLEEKLDVTQLLFGFDPELDTLKSAAFMKRFSPTNYISESIPPTIMIHGKADQIVPINQSHILKAKLDSLGIENEIHILPGADHAFRGATQEQKDSIQVWVVDFVLKYKK